MLDKCKKPLEVEEVMAKMVAVAVTLYDNRLYEAGFRNSRCLVGKQKWYQ